MDLDCRRGRLARQRYHWPPLDHPITGITERWSALRRERGVARDFSGLRLSRYLLRLMSRAGTGMIHAKRPCTGSGWERSGSGVRLHLEARQHLSRKL